MEKQQASPNWTVIIAGLVLMLAAGALAGALYFYDGLGMLASLPDQIASSDVWTSIRALSGSPKPVPSVTPSSTAAAAPTELRLPDGMPEDFALRLWQEQVDSQAMIGRLVNGDVTTMAITKVDTSSDVSTLTVLVTLHEGGNVDGRIVMRKFGDAWYVSTVTAEERGSSTASSPLPTVDEVDIALLNTMIAEQRKSRKITSEYADGKVASIEIKKGVLGPNTVRIPVIMKEDHETSSADLVAIKQQFNGQDLWFLARFGKTGSSPVSN